MTQDARTWRARLDDVHDGDTIRLVIDTGFDTTCRKWMRLSQKGGPSARGFTRIWLDQHQGVTPVSWPFEVDTYRTSGDNDVITLDRYVAEVRAAADGASLNAAVIAYLALHPTWGKGIGG